MARASFFAWATYGACVDRHRLCSHDIVCFAETLLNAVPGRVAEVATTCSMLTTRPLRGIVLSGGTRARITRRFRKSVGAMPMQYLSCVGNELADVGPDLGAGT